MKYLLDSSSLCNFFLNFAICSFSLLCAASCCSNWNSISLTHSSMSFVSKSCNLPASVFSVAATLLTSFTYLSCALTRDCAPLFTSSAAFIIMNVALSSLSTVSYTHLTLPTICSV
eukprot:TRINITY_DN2603_c0_g1_i11.p2 TRINITY_DN2603_c0_g1~~TRINITY_DN2603_c0_g1_i11.p2  ORF type:complete len:116 (-),score=12.05 TRINITY_DN2603_c0_g1_i11:41-388(-)